MNNWYDGQKIVCIDDKFVAGIAALYTALPKEGITYVIRDIRIGRHQPGGEGDISLLLIGLVNPKANSRAALERGFSETRFRPLDELKTKTKGTMIVGNGRPEIFVPKIEKVEA